MDTELLMVDINPSHFIFNMYTPTTTLDDQKQQNPFNVTNAQLKDILDTPTTFEEAYYHCDNWIREQWQEAINLELK
jgi:hypothetical protein